jgi:hypothetical protein
MKATKITAEQLKNDEAREYNPQVWERKVDSYSKYNDVQFYKVEKGNGYDYCRYFVVYTLPEGLRLLNTFSYSSSITNGGFQEAIITEASYEIVDGKLITTDFPEGEVEIKGRKFKDEDGKECWINTSEEARRWMTERSNKFGSIFTKEGI